MTKNKAGSVKRIENGIIGVVTHDPKHPDYNLEVYIPEENI